MLLCYHNLKAKLQPLMKLHLVFAYPCDFKLCCIAVATNVFSVPPGALRMKGVEQLSFVDLVDIEFCTLNVDWLIKILFQKILALASRHIICKMRVGVIAAK